MEKKIIHLSEEMIENVIRETLVRLYEIDDEEKARDIYGRLEGKGIITEGLISTYPCKSTLNMIKKWNARKYGVFAMPLGNSRGQQEIYLSFNNGMRDISSESFFMLFGRLDTYGWYFAKVMGDESVKEINEESYIYLKGKEKFTIIIEPKFDLLLDDENVPDKFYHITKLKNVDKIMRKGILPRTSDKFSSHPERVYLFGEYPSSWLETADFFRDRENSDDRYCLLEIDGRKVNRTNNLYYDPNSNYIEAYYTLEPIPPMAITIKEKEE